VIPVATTVSRAVLTTCVVLRFVARMAGVSRTVAGLLPVRREISFVALPGRLAVHR